MRPRSSRAVTKSSCRRWRPPGAAPPVWQAHVDSVVDTAAGVALPDRDLVLVGHSAAGRLIPLIAEQLGGACVFVDAQLPGFPGPTPATDDWFLTHVRPLTVDGMLPPWSQWWGTAAWEGLVPDPARRGWRVTHVDGGHLHFAVAEAVVADALVEIAQLFTV